MRLAGSLDAFGLPDVLQLLTSTGKTGALRLERGTTTAVVRVRAGVLSGARADLAREDLGRRLVGLGAVAEPALREAVTATARTRSGLVTGLGTGLGPALRDLGAVDEALLLEVATAVTVDAVAELLRWPEGEFAFLADEPDPDELGLALDAAQALAEGARRLADWPGLLRVVATLDAVPRVCSTVAEGTAASADEWALLALVDGRRTVGELVALTGRGEYAVTAQLVALVQRGLVTVRREGVDADPVVELARRQALLAPLEGLAAPAGGSATPPPPPPATGDALDVPAVTAVPPAAPVPTQPALTTPPRPLVPASAPVSAAPLAPARATAPARVDPVPVSAALTGPGTAPVTPSAGVPAARTPHSGGPPTAGPVGSLGSAAVAYQSAPTPAPPDPAVTRGLLLRLIAGVQGL